MYFSRTKEKQCKIAMVLLCPAQGPWASSLTSCSLWYPYVKKLHRVPYLAFGTNFFPKITTAKTPTTAEHQLRHAHTETS